MFDVSVATLSRVLQIVTYKAFGSNFAMGS